MAIQKKGADKGAAHNVVARNNAQKSAAKGHEHVDTGAQIESAIDRTELFIHNNRKTLIWGMVAVLVVVGGYFIVRNINRTRNENATNALYVARQLFNGGEWQEALDGDGINEGLLDVINRYGSTRAGHLASHYAGICYIQLGDNATALTYLRKYSPASGEAAEIINAQNAGLQGAAYVATGDLNAAAKAYRRAVKASNNNLTTPYYLKELGAVYEQLGDAKAALDVYNRIKNEFPGSMEGQTIDLYIGAAEQM